MRRREDDPIKRGWCPPPPPTNCNDCTDSKPVSKLSLPLERIQCRLLWQSNMILCEFAIILSWKSDLSCCVSDQRIVCDSLKVLFLFFASLLWWLANNGLKEAIAIKALPILSLSICTGKLIWDTDWYFWRWIYKLTAGALSKAFHSALLVKEYGGVIIALYPVITYMHLAHELSLSLVINSTDIRSTHHLITGTNLLCGQETK